MLKVQIKRKQSELIIILSVEGKPLNTDIWNNQTNRPWQKQDKGMV